MAPTIKIKLNKVVRVLVEPIDLTKYKMISKWKYYLPNHLQKNNENEKAIKINHSYDTIYPYSNLSKSKYEKIASRKASPSPNNISKLNLFRNIYQENNPNLALLSVKNNFFDSNNKIIRINGNNNAKYYKLNELVSIRINEDYFRENPFYTGTLTPDDSMDINDDDENNHFSHTINRNSIATSTSEIQSYTNFLKLI